jgi:hypothetical protein
MNFDWAFETKELNDINLLDIGNSVQISGAIWSGNGKHYLCFFPDEDIFEHDFLFLEMNVEDWGKFLKQTDLMETEILAKDTEGKVVKAIVRKSTRQIDTKIQWQVFKRDGYKCRYCGNDNTPLTVDHIVLWEEGGPSTEQNLITACKKCNKTRGNMQYKDWINSPYYEKVAKNLSDSIRLLNEKVLDYIDQIPRKVNITSR